MTYTVTIRQHDAPITVEIGQTILEAALAQGVPYPHGCRSGNCGACKSRLISGDVEMSPYSEYALSDDERSDGLILACRAVPWEDAEIAWLGEDDVIAHPLRKMRCRVAEIEDVTHDIRRVRLEIDVGGPFAFTAGQYASLTFVGQPARDYSMANTPGDPVLEFHIRRVPDGAVSNFVGDALQPGDEVRVEGPYGSSWLRDAHRGPIVALAGGALTFWGNQTLFDAVAVSGTASITFKPVGMPLDQVEFDGIEAAIVHGCRIFIHVFGGGILAVFLRAFSVVDSCFSGFCRDCGSDFRG